MEEIIVTKEWLLIECVERHKQKCKLCKKQTRPTDDKCFRAILKVAMKERESLKVLFKDLVKQKKPITYAKFAQRAALINATTALVIEPIVKKIEDHKDEQVKKPKKDEDEKYVEIEPPVIDYEGGLASIDDIIPEKNQKKVYYGKNYLNQTLPYVEVLEVDGIKLTQIKIVPKRACQYCSLSGVPGVCIECRDLFELLKRSPHYHPRLGVKRTTVARVARTKGYPAAEAVLERARKKFLKVERPRVVKQPLKDFDLSFLPKLQQEEMTRQQRRVHEMLEKYENGTEAEKQGGFQVFAAGLIDAFKSIIKFLTDQNLVRPLLFLVVEVILVGILMWIMMRAPKTFAGLVLQGVVGTIVGIVTFAVGYILAADLYVSIYDGISALVQKAQEMKLDTDRLSTAFETKISDFIHGREKSTTETYDDKPKIIGTTTSPKIKYTGLVERNGDTYHVSPTKEADGTVIGYYLLNLRTGQREWEQASDWYGTIRPIDREPTDVEKKITREAEMLRRKRAGKQPAKEGNPFYSEDEESSVEATKQDDEPCALIDSSDDEAGEEEVVKQLATGRDEQYLDMWDQGIDMEIYKEAYIWERTRGVRFSHTTTVTYIHKVDNNNLEVTLMEECKTGRTDIFVGQDVYTYNKHFTIEREGYFVADPIVRTKAKTITTSYDERNIERGTTYTSGNHTFFVRNENYGKEVEEWMKKPRKEIKELLSEDDPYFDYFHWCNKHYWEFKKQGGETEEEKTASSFVEILKTGFREVVEKSTELAGGAAKVTFKDATDRLHAASVIVRDSKTLFDVIGPLAKWIVATGYELSTGKPYISAEDKQYYDAWMPLFDEICLVEKEPNFDQMLLSMPAFKAQVSKIVDRYEDIIKTFPKVNKDRYSALFLTKQNTINTWKMKIKEAAVAGKDRPEPVWVSLHGKRGAMKTVFMKLLFEAVHETRRKMKQTVDVPFSPTMVFDRFSEKVYWDGYNGQEYLMVDDYLQALEPKLRMEAALESMKIVNTAAYGLNMSAVPDKANHFMQAKLYVTSTNTDFNPTGINLQDPIAHSRRRTLLLEISRKEYLTQPSDPKFLEGYRITLHDSYGKKVGDISWDETISLIVDYMHEREVWHASKPYVKVTQVDVSGLKTGLDKARVEGLSQPHQVHSDEVKEEVKKYFKKNKGKDRWVKKQGLSQSSQKTIVDEMDDVLESTIEAPAPTLLAFIMEESEKSEEITLSSSWVENLVIREKEAAARNEVSTALGLYYWTKKWTERFGKAVKDAWFTMKNWTNEKIERMNKQLSALGEAWKGNPIPLIKNWLVESVKDITAAIQKSTGLKILFSLLGAIALIGTLGGIWYGVHSFFKNDSPDAIQESWDEQKKPGNRSDKRAEIEKERDRTNARLVDEALGRVRTNRGMRSAAHYQNDEYGVNAWTRFAEATKQVGATDTPLVTMVEKNLYYFVGPVGLSTKGGNLLFVSGRFAVTAKHVTDALLNSEEKLWRIEKNLNGEHTWKGVMSDLKISHIPETEAVLVEFPPRVPQHRDIVDHFASADDVAGEANRTLTGVAILSKLSTGVVVTRELGDATVGVYKPYSSDPAGLFWKSTVGGTMGGDSGGLWFTSNTRMQRRLLGVHSGANPAYAVCSPVFKDVLRPLVGHPGVVLPDPLIEMEESKIVGSIAGGYLPMGSVEKQFSTTLPHKNPISPSPIASQLYAAGVTTKTLPSTVNKFRPHNMDANWKGKGVKYAEVEGITNEEVSPLHFGLAKMEFTLPNVPISGYRGLFSDWYRSWPKRRDGIYTVYSPEDIIYGNANADVDPVRTNASPGWPFTVTQGMRTRKQIFGEKPKDLHESFLKALQRIAGVNEGDSDYLPVYVISEKVERRPVAKALCGNTRLFFAGPVDFQVYGQMMFYSFMQTCKMDPTGEWVFGIDPESPMWGLLAQRLMKHPNAMASDAKSWDVSQEPVAIEFITEQWGKYIEVQRVVNRIQTLISNDSLPKHMKKALRGCSQALLLLLDKLFMVTFGARSGSFLTTLFNCMLNSIRWRLVIAIALVEQNFDFKGRTPEQVWQDEVEAAFHGDDAVVAVSDLLARYIDQQKAEAYWLKLFNITLTAPTKDASGESSKFTPWKDVVFLKRTFFQGPKSGDTFWYAPIDKDVINDMVLWVTDPADAVSICKDNVVTALRYAAHHERDYFNKLSVKLEKACNEVGVPFLGKSYDEYRSEFHKDTQLVYYGNAEKQCDCYPNDPGKSINYLYVLRDLPSDFSTDLVKTDCYSTYPEWDESTLLHLKSIQSWLGDPVSRETDKNTEIANTAGNMIPDTDVNVPVTHEVALTQKAEVTVQEVSDQPRKVSTFQDTDAGYVPPDVPEALFHLITVADFPWTYAHVHGEKIEWIEFPAKLQEHPNIVAKLMEYRLFSADVEVKIQVAGTAFHFGELSWNFIPRVAADGLANTYYNSGPQALSNNPRFIQANGFKEETIILRRVPLSTFDYTVNDPHCIGTLFCHVLAPLRLAGSGTEPTPLRVVVQARFLPGTLRLAGYGENDSAIPLIEAALKKRKLLKERLKIKNELGQELKENERDMVKQSKKHKMNQQEEAKAKSEGGVVSTILAAASSFAPILAASPLAEFAPFAVLAGAVAPVFRSMGLSKPVSLVAPQPIVSGARQKMSQGAGLSQHQRMQVHPDGLASTHINFMSQPDIRELAQYPAHVGTFFFDKTFAAGTTLRNIPLVPFLCHRTNAATDTWNPGWMAYYSQFYYRWRGGFKIMIRFNCSQFTSAGIRLTHNPYGVVSADPEGEAPDRVSSVLQIRGPTVYTFSVPYISENPWSMVYGFEAPSTTGPVWGDNDSIQISVFQPARTTDEVGDSSVYYSIYIAGADDIDFKDYCGFLLRKTQNEWESEAALERRKPAKKQSLEDLFAKPFEPLHPALKGFEAGFVKSESCTNIVELMHAECLITGALPPDYAGADATLENHNAMLIKPFQFWRGSTRWRFIYSAIPGRLELKNANSYNSSWMTGKTALAQRFPYILQDTTTPDDVVEVPWSQSTVADPFVEGSEADLMDEETTYFQRGVAPQSYTQGWYSVGDDFMVGGRVPPPPFIVADPPSMLEKTISTVSLSDDLGETISSSSGKKV